MIMAAPHVDAPAWLKLAYLLGLLLLARAMAQP